MTQTALGGQAQCTVGGFQGFSLYDNRILAAVDTIMDATLESVMMIGQIFTSDGATHTIDTTGSSNLGFLTGASLVFANAGTLFTYGIGSVDATGPVPVRATNVANAITFDVSNSYIGTDAHGMTSTTWFDAAPDAGTKTIANGDFVSFGFQMVTRAGSDLIAVRTGGNSQASNRPTVTSFLSSTYSGVASMPNAAITFSDGAFGFFFGTYIFETTSNTTTWNSGSVTKEYGNYFSIPVPVTIYGYQISGVNPSADFDSVLYLDPLGTPSAVSTIAIDKDQVATASAGRTLIEYLATPYSLAANTPIALIIKPGATNVAMTYKSVHNTNHNLAMSLGNGCYAINRATGAFAAQNSGKDRYNVSLIIGAFDNGSGGGGGAIPPFSSLIVA